MRVTPAPSRTRRFEPASWQTLGLVLAMIAISAAATIASLTQVGDGCVYDPDNDAATVLAVCVGGWATPLRAGDELLVVGDRSWQDQRKVTPLAAPFGSMENGTLHYTVRRAGQTLDLDVPLHRVGWDGILRAFGYGLVRQANDWNALAFLGAVVIFALAPRARAAQLLLLAIGGLTAVTALAWPGKGVGTEFAPAPLWFLESFLGLRDAGAGAADAGVSSLPGDRDHPLPAV